jgi:vacuolar-type H+-ATPase subunit F/Vma7
MGRIAVLGAPAVVRGWGLAGLLVVGAPDAAAALAGWAALPADVSLVIVTPAAAEALGARLDGTDRLVAVLP